MRGAPGRRNIVGIGKWSDGQLVYALRTGIRPNGNFLPIYMPKFPLMSDEDVRSVIAYLRSDRKEVQAVHTKTAVSSPSFLTKLLCNTVAKPYPYPKNAIITPDSSDKVAYGKYLVQGRYTCFGCHSADFKKLDELHPENSLGYCGGGNELIDKEGKSIKSLNITSDKETGIGNWSENDFKLTLRMGIVKNENALRYPMMPYTRLSDTELSSIYTYLQSVSAIKNKIERKF